MEQTKYVMIDPPMGWRFGFPITITREEYNSITNFMEWCISKGYPRDIAEPMGKWFSVRIIDTDEYR